MERSCTEIVSVHRVGSREKGEIGVYVDTTVTPDDLEHYFTARESWHRSTCAELRAALGGEPAGRRSFILTCDDGYSSFTSAVLPLLEKYGVSCMLFVTTGFISGELAPYEMVLADYFASARETKLPDRGSFMLDDRSAREELYGEVRLALKPASPADRLDYLRRLFAANGRDMPLPRAGEFLSWKELRETARHPLITVGAHTVNHPLLTALSVREAFRELRRSKAEIEARVAMPVDAVAYPYGGQSFVVRSLARLAGFRLGFGTRAALIRENSKVDRLALPRFDLTDLLAGRRVPPAGATRGTA